MVTRLANILRHTLTRGREATTETLAEQLAVVADYLELESIRFDERLRTHFAIAPETRDCPLPAMLLQTLVENAIKHGIAHLPAGGEVTISSRVTDAHLELVVENPGELGTRSARSTGVGLANARERLRMLHGPDASLELQALTHHRVQARLRLPLRGPHAPSSVTSTETNSR
jgi:LytS/YehU family sensor histidine kinase